MSDPLDALRSRYDRIAIPNIWLAVALSLMLHAILLAGWRPKLHLLPFEDLEHDKPGHSLAVRLVPLPDAAVAPPPSRAPAPAMQTQPAPAHRPRPLMPARQQPSAPQSAPQSTPHVLAIERPSPSGAATPPASDDFTSFVEARRRAREPATAPAMPPSQASAPAAPAQSDEERRNRIVAGNLGLDRAPTFGANRKHGGGIFQVERIGYDDAEFFFFGWNKAISRNSQQMIEVRRGSNPSTELAVVRKMIAIIREHEQGDFVWESLRLGRDVNLSARLSDNAGLEDSLMQEFFSGARPRN
jgi:hypothetical protein